MNAFLMLSRLPSRPQPQKRTCRTRQGLDDHRWIWDIEAADKATRGLRGPWGDQRFRTSVVTSWFVLVRDPRAAFIPSGEACSDGFVDPMSHYHSQAWVGGMPSRLYRLLWSSSKAHPLFPRRSAVGRAKFPRAARKGAPHIRGYEADFSP